MFLSGLTRLFSSGSTVRNFFSNRIPNMFRSAGSKLKMAHYKLTDKDKYENEKTIKPERIDRLYQECNYLLQEYINCGYDLNFPLVNVDSSKMNLIYMRLHGQTPMLDKMYRIFVIQYKDFIADYNKINVGNWKTLSKFGFAVLLIGNSDWVTRVTTKKYNTDEFIKMVHAGNIYSVQSGDRTCGLKALKFDSGKQAESINDVDNLTTVKDRTVSTATNDDFKNKISQLKATFSEAKDKYDTAKEQYDDLKGQYDTVKDTYDDVRQYIDDIREKLHVDTSFTDTTSNQIDISKLVKNANDVSNIANIVSRSEGTVAATSQVGSGIASMITIISVASPKDSDDARDDEKDVPDSKDADIMPNDKKDVPNNQDADIIPSDDEKDVPNNKGTADKSDSKGATDNHIGKDTGQQSNPEGDTKAASDDDTSDPLGCSADPAIKPSVITKITDTVDKVNDVAEKVNNIKEAATNVTNTISGIANLFGKLMK